MLEERITTKEGYVKVHLPQHPEAFEEFVFDYLRKKHILTVFGSGFGPFGNDGFRMVYLPTLEEINIAMNRLEELLRENRI